MTHDNIHDTSAVWCAGHGIMWDGAVNTELTSLLESAVNRNAIVATCGHGAVALLEVKTKHNATVDYFVKNKEANHDIRCHTIFVCCMLWPRGGNVRQWCHVST
jgi:hypothetical protein